MTTATSPEEIGRSSLGDTCVLHVSVRDRTGGPLTDARVELRRDDVPIAEGMTDATGLASFKGVEVGEVEIRAWYEAIPAAGRAHDLLSRPSWGAVEPGPKRVLLGDGVHVATAWIELCHTLRYKYPWQNPEIRKGLYWYYRTVSAESSYYNDRSKERDFALTRFINLYDPGALLRLDPELEAKDRHFALVKLIVEDVFPGCGLPDWVKFGILHFSGLNYGNPPDRYRSPDEILRRWRWWEIAKYEHTRAATAARNALYAREYAAILTAHPTLAGTAQTQFADSLLDAAATQPLDAPRGKPDPSAKLVDALAGLVPSAPDAETASGDRSKDYLLLRAVAIALTRALVAGLTQPDRGPSAPLLGVLVDRCHSPRRAFATDEVAGLWEEVSARTELFHDLPPTTKLKTDDKGDADPEPYANNKWLSPLPKQAPWHVADKSGETVAFRGGILDDVPHSTWKHYSEAFYPYFTTIQCNHSAHALGLARGAGAAGGATHNRNINELVDHDLKPQVPGGHRLLVPLEASDYQVGDWLILTDVGQALAVPPAHLPPEHRSKMRPGTGYLHVGDVVDLLLDGVPSAVWRRREAEREASEPSSPPRTPKVTGIVTFETMHAPLGIGVRRSLSREEKSVVASALEDEKHAKGRARTERGKLGGLVERELYNAISDTFVDHRHAEVLIARPIQPADSSVAPDLRKHLAPENVLGPMAPPSDKAAP